MPEPALTRRSLFAYGLLALPLAFAGLPLYVNAPDFYATRHGLTLGMLGIVLLLLRGADAVQDPFIGYISDRYPKRRFAIMLGAVGVLMASFYALFHPPSHGTLPWFAGSMFFSTASFGVLTINLNTLGGVWPKDSHQKRRITGVREAIGLFGMMCAVVLPTLLRQQLSPDAAFNLFSLILIGLLLLGAVFFILWFRRHRTVLEQRTPGEQPHGLFASFFGFSKPVRKFFIVYGVSIFASTIPAVLVIFFIRDRLNAESSAGLFLICYFLAGALFMPFWLALAKRIGNVHAWCISMLIAAMSFIWAFLLTEGDTTPYLIICIASGIAFGAELALPPAILADLMHAGKGRAKETAHFAMFTFLGKIGLAAASALTLPVLDAFGFHPNAVNSSSALFALSATYALIPSLIKALGIVLLCVFITDLSDGNLHEKHHARH